ncbi:MAG: YigZ family protein [Chitinophagaceae bacterium]
MTEKEFYYTIEKTANATFTDRGSRFIAFAFPIAVKEDFKLHLAAVKTAHAKATHFCFAYRIGLDGNNFRSGDDGEPSGTAGKPILGQIDSKELTNTLIIVVRYFGGSLLGVPGLINAYKTAASLVLQVTPVQQKQVEVNYHLQFDYTMMNDIMTIVKLYNCSILSQEMQLFCSMNVGIPVNRVDSILNRLQDIRNIEVVKLK